MTVEISLSSYTLMMMSMMLMLQFFVCSACPCALGSCSVAWCQIPGFINACCVRRDRGSGEQARGIQNTNYYHIANNEQDYMQLFIYQIKERDLKNLPHKDMFLGSFSISPSCTYGYFLRASLKLYEGFELCNLSFI